MVIFFKSDKARNFLLKNGWVFTFRAHKRRKLGKDWITDGRGRPKIADVVVEEVRTMQLLFPDSALSPYVRHSGFSSPDEWLREIKRLNKGKTPLIGWMYKVTLMENK